MVEGFGTDFLDFDDGRDSNDNNAEEQKRQRKKYRKRGGGLVLTPMRRFVRHR